MAGAVSLFQLAPTSSSAQAQTIAGDKAQAAAIAARLNSLGAEVAQLMQKYNQAQGTLNQINQRADNTQSQISQDQTKIKSIKSELASEAINQYVSGGNLTAIYSLITVNPEQASVRQEYLNTVTSSQSDLIASFQSTTQNLNQEKSSLKSLKAQALTQLKQVTAAQNAAQNSVNQEKAQLNSVNSTIANLVAQQQAAIAEAKARQAAAAAAAAAAEAAAAAASAAASANNSAPAASPGSNVGPAPAGYGDPLRAVSGLYSERIDQGVDFKGYGPIFAIGNGVVLNTYNGGWPGGTYIAYRLTSGPAAGKIVYVGEDVRPLVGVGQSVNSGTIIGTMYEGFDGIETGWASPAMGETMARYSGQFYGANSTAYGYNFSQLLRSLGSAGGILQNNPPTGSLPSGWPQW